MLIHELLKSLNQKWWHLPLISFDLTFFYPLRRQRQMCIRDRTYLVKNLNDSNEINISKSQPISIVASNSKKFNSNWKYFRQPIRRWLISSSKIDDSSNNEFEKQLLFDDSWAKTLISLKKQGINDIALLGGAKLINSFIKEDLITDIKITIIPRIIGGRYTWIPPKQTNEIFNLKRLWEIKSIKNLMNNEIHVQYKKI